MDNVAHAHKLIREIYESEKYGDLDMNKLHNIKYMCNKILKNIKITNAPEIEFNTKIKISDTNKKFKKKCYICIKPILKNHDFYKQLCQVCGFINFTPLEI